MRYNSGMHIKEEYREETIIKKSQFIACIKTCKTELEARDYIEQIRSEYSDATHVCTAFICGKNNEIQRSSDNGEPAGTAGVPILEALKKSDIQDICACVVRYFGGIKLGAGGLIRAYSSATSTAIQNAPKTKVVSMLVYNISYSYGQVGQIENYLRKNGRILDTNYSDNVISSFICEESIEVTNDIQNISKGLAHVECIEKTYDEVDA